MVINYKDLYLKYISIIYKCDSYKITNRLNKLSECNLRELE